MKFTENYNGGEKRRGVEVVQRAKGSQRRNARVIYVFITTPHNAGTVRIRRVSTVPHAAPKGPRVHGSNFSVEFLTRGPSHEPRPTARRHLGEVCHSVRSSTKSHKWSGFRG
jgi:hypothetical protein